VFFGLTKGMLFTVSQQGKKGKHAGLIVGYCHAQRITA
jgi:hypothetical protein